MRSPRTGMLTRRVHAWQHLCTTLWACTGQALETAAAAAVSHLQGSKEPPLWRPFCPANRAAAHAGTLCGY